MTGHKQLANVTSVDVAITHNVTPLLYLCVFRHGYILCFRRVGGSDGPSTTVTVALSVSSLGRGSNLISTVRSDPSYVVLDIASESEVPSGDMCAR